MKSLCQRVCRFLILFTVSSPGFLSVPAMAQQINPDNDLVDVGKNPKSFKKDLSLDGTVWAIRWEGPREEIVENKILAEFGKRKIHAKFVVSRLGATTDPCRNPRQPTICVVIHNLTSNPVGFESSYSYLTGSGRRWSNSSYESTSGNVTSYAVVVSLELYLNDSSTESPRYIAAAGKQFFISAGTSYSASFGLFGGASSTFTSPGNVRGTGMWAAEGAFKDLLKKNPRHWAPEAPELLAQTFHQ